MKKLRIAVLELVTNGPKNAFYARLMNANLAAIMPQVIAVWCKQMGHDVKFLSYTGFENLFKEVPDDRDVVFISAYSQSAQLSYALSNYHRQRGAVTIVGGAHARCYPEDASKYFDYVLGLTDKQLLRDLLSGCLKNSTGGVYLTAKRHPCELASVEERWEFIEASIQKAPWIKIVHLLGGFGCPYDCNFCIESGVEFIPLNFEHLKDDLRFILKKFRHPRVGWEDANFGVRFDDCMDAIEEAVPPNSIDFIAESSLSILNESRLKRLQKNGFKVIFPGVESWYDFGNKSNTGSYTGKEKVRLVAEHLNLVLRYIPLVQANFLIGLDRDWGTEPFELTKQFIDLSSGIFPGFALLTAFGEAAPLNLELQKTNRVLPFPFHFLNNNGAMNVRPLNYSWTELYDNIIDLVEYAYSWRNIRRRLAAQQYNLSGWVNLMRTVSSEGFGRLKYYKSIRSKLEQDLQFRRFFEGETNEIPLFYREIVKRDLGPLWNFLPEGALEHDPNAFLRKSSRESRELDSSSDSLKPT